MKSHTCEFEVRDLLPMLLRPLAVVAGFAVLVQLAASVGLLPQPRPTLDTDRTILIHQADASRKRDEARILLMGDSSCLMGVSARLLSEKLGQPVLNLATLSYLDAGANSRLLREFATTNPGQLRTVVLLMHPEALRRIGSESYHRATLTNYLAGTDYHRMGTRAEQVSRWVGLEIFRSRILTRTVPSPLAGYFGHTYGFSSDLEEFMTANRGSLIELDSVPLTGSTEYRLSPSLQDGALEFKMAMPTGVKLLVGLTPVPEKFAGPGYAGTHREILRQWSDWLGADVMLDHLPVTMPDEKFARTTHLKPDAVPDYTEALGHSIKQHLQ